MNLNKVKVGTKLMWDSSNLPNGVKHPVIIAEIAQNKVRSRKVMNSDNWNWMCGENEYLRYPTKEEFETLEWPELVKPFRQAIPI